MPSRRLAEGPGTRDTPEGPAARGGRLATAARVLVLDLELCRPERIHAPSLAPRQWSERHFGLTGAPRDRDDADRCTASILGLEWDIERGAESEKDGLIKIRCDFSTCLHPKKRMTSAETRMLAHRGVVLH